MLFLDLETTGFDSEKDKIIEIGIIKTDKNLKEISRLSFFINPQNKVSEEILNLTGISQKDIDEGFLFEEKKEEIQNFIENDVIIGHNISFDIAFLKKNGIKIENNSIDTLFLAQSFLKESQSFAQEILADFLEIKNENAHRAIYDCETNLKIVEKIGEKISKNLGQDFLNDFEQSFGNSAYLAFFKVNITKEKSIKVEKNEKIFLKKEDCTFEKQIFEFSNLKNLFEKTELFLSQKGKKLVILEKNFIDIFKKEFGIYTNISFLENFGEINEENFGIKLKNKEYQEKAFGLFLDILVQKYIKGKILKKNLVLSHGNNFFWEKISLKNDFSLEKNEIIFTEYDFFEENFEKFKDFEKLFIEKNIFEEDLFFTDLKNSLKNILDEKIKQNAKNDLEYLHSVFLDKDIGPYGKTIEIDCDFLFQNPYKKECLLGFLKNLEENNSKFLENNFLEKIKKFQDLQNNFSFLQITADDLYIKSIPKNSKKTLFKNSSFGFFGSSLKKDFALQKDILGIEKDLKISFEENNDFELRIFDSKKYKEILEKNNKIGFCVSSKKEINDIYSFFSGKVDFEVFGEKKTGGKGKIIQKLKKSEKYILIGKDSFFNYLNFEEIDFDVLIFTKLQFTPPSKVVDKKRKSLDFNFDDFDLKKALIKTKKVVVSSGAKEVLFTNEKIKQRKFGESFLNIFS